METTTCNLCGSPSASYRYTLADYYLQRFDVEATLVQCSQCGLVYQNPRPTFAEMAAHYPPQYVPYQIGSTRRVSWLLRQAYDYGLRKRSRFVTRHKLEGALLDVGCATGEFLQGMRRQGGWQVHGVELTPEVAQIARDRHQLDIFTGTLEQAAYPAKRFDVVTLWDVLEHLYDPAATLREIHRILKDDGILLIRVPNLASWDARLFGRYWAGLDAPRHLYIYTPQTLTQLLRQNGFCVREHRGASSAYIYFVLSVQFRLNGHMVAPRAKRLLLGILNHPAAQLVSAPFFYLLSRFSNMSVLMTIAAKDAG